MNILKDKLKKLRRKIYCFRFPYFKAYANLLIKFNFSIKLFLIWLKNVLFFDQMIRFQCNKVGKNIFIWKEYPSILNKGYIEMGDNINIFGENYFRVGIILSDINKPRLIIGNNVDIGYQCDINVAGIVSIGNNVFLANGVKIFDNNSHPLDIKERQHKSPLANEHISPVVIKDDAWIGINAIILKGVTIGRGAIIGAGSVVTKDIPDNVIAVGNPARVIKDIK